MFNTIVGAGAVRAGAASRYGSGSDQMMRFLAAPAPQHWFSRLTEGTCKLLLITVSLGCKLHFFTSQFNFKTAELLLKSRGDANLMLLSPLLYLVSFFAV
jgi:hypothetical protein